MEMHLRSMLSLPGAKRYLNCVWCTIMMIVQEHLRQKACSYEQVHQAFSIELLACCPFMQMSGHLQLLCCIYVIPDLEPSATKMHQ